MHCIIWRNGFNYSLNTGQTKQQIKVDSIQKILHTFADQFGAMYAPGEPRMKDKKLIDFFKTLSSCSEAS